MNILLLIFAVLLFCNIVNGYKKGMVKEIISFVSLIVLCIVVALIGNGLKSYFDGEIVSVIIMVLLLCILGIVHHLLGVVFFSAKLIAKLPIVHSLDKILGIVFGVLETILIVWTIYTFVMLFNLGMLGEQIVEYTRSSELLTWFYEHNYLADWVQQLGVQFHIL